LSGRRDVDCAKSAGTETALVERLESDPGPNEREEIERLLAKIETALSLLDPDGPAGGGD
jgi:hypothetical protein